jgi:nitrate/nitrite-specific signal transduction histidine kinase
LEGLREINKGNLDTYITPKVQDEIGYLTLNFNNMAQQIKESQQQLQDYADNLEKKVEERTAELKQSFEEIKELKQQQDGDYFLTSLLIKPLGTNEVESEVTEIDFLVKQKKQFRFRHWDMDIGGDICMASTITLNNKTFTVFLNGDAMGKSVQGAGGALVLGVIFRAFLARTKMIANEQKRYPEQW